MPKFSKKIYKELDNKENVQTSRQEYLLSSIDCLVLDTTKITSTVDCDDDLKLSEFDKKEAIRAVEQMKSMLTKLEGKLNDK